MSHSYEYPGKRIVPFEGDPNTETIRMTGETNDRREGVATVQSSDRSEGIALTPEEVYPSNDSVARSTFDLSELGVSAMIETRE